MQRPNLTTRTGAPATIPGDALGTLRGGMAGDVLTPDDAGYDDARRIWNGMIDRHPAMIACCESADDVRAAMVFAATHDLLVTVRGGGHNIAGNAVADGALLIDLSAMKDVRVDPVARTARVQAGCTLGDVDAATQTHGLAVPTGINSTTGIAGLTLGGGFGWLSRKHGMTIDNLLSAEVITVDGRRVTASPESHPDLFWALRGGGGNFGIVTSFEFRLHAVGPEVLSGLIVHPLEDAPALLRDYRDFASGLGDETAAWVVLRKAPPLPFLPEAWHGREVLVFAAFHAGDMAEGERILAPLRAIGNPIADVIGPHPYAGWQQAFDPLLTKGARNYWKSHNFSDLDDALLEKLVGYAEALPTSECEVFIGQVGGAMARVPEGATAYPHRDAAFIMNVHARWSEPAGDDPCITWSRKLFNDTAEHATGGVYVNFLTSDEIDRVAAAYGSNHARLAEIKHRYDPDNRLRMNQNIRPAAEA